jgi:co-chaperonin GroES (HSP10)
MNALGDRIFLSKDEFSEKIGSIYIPYNNDSKSPPYTGIVKYVGTDVDDDDIKPGVRIAFQDLAGDDIKVNDEKLLMIRYRNITGIFLENS